jgi:hypothetical protein
VTGRVDVTGAAFAGSQLQTQLWVNERPTQLADSIATLFDDLETGAISWVSPMREDGYREYQDRAFLGRLGLESLDEQLADFWPGGGPVWDGLAIVDGELGPGVVLIEGKGYPGELYGSGCQATEKSRNKIENALAATQTWLGVAQTPQDWTGALYQTANRLAHLYWLNEVVGIRAWFVHALFLDDETHRPTTQAEWETALPQADMQLGLSNVPGAGHIFLPAGSRADLVGDTR